MKLTFENKREKYYPISSFGLVLSCGVRARKAFYFTRLLRDLTFYLGALKGITLFGKNVVNSVVEEWARDVLMEKNKQASRYCHCQDIL